MKLLKLFIEISRLDKPIGIILLFWPCLWGLTLAYNFETNLNNYFLYLFLFFMGSVLMRSAGCIMNDIFDKNFDKKVMRTKNRPVASEKISIKFALFLVVFLCMLSFLVLINFNNTTIYLALASMPLAFSYPLMKRVTYWPQLFLGITFNYGIILGWASINESLSFAPILLYIGAIFWTLGYDTIYGFQDIKDDEIIGVKSTSIKFKKEPKKFLIICYLLLILCLIFLGYTMNFNLIFYIFLIIPFYYLLFYQIRSLDISSPESCLKIFKSNSFLGFIVFLNILIGKIYSV